MCACVCARVRVCVMCVCVFCCLKVYTAKTRHVTENGLSLPDVLAFIQCFFVVFFNTYTFFHENVKQQY